MIKRNETYYIFGNGKLGKYLQKFLHNNGFNNFQGFLDNISVEGNVFKPEVIENKNITVLIASINYMYEITMLLKSLGFNKIISFADLTLEFPELQNFNQAFYGLREDYYRNKKQYDKLREMLVDNKSKKVLDTIIEFRKTYNVELYSEISDDVNKQYFENFMPKNIDVYADGGGFDGDTVKRAIKYFSPKKIYFFEPDIISLDKAKKNLKCISEIKNIKYFPNGLADKKKSLKFNSTGDLGSCCSDNGNTNIECITLDETIKEDVAYIKLDVEGFEQDAILGAERLIKNGSPYAVCVYHKPPDIWQIPELLSDIAKAVTLNNRCNGGGYMLRHYTNSIFETVLYGGF